VQCIGGWESTKVDSVIMHASCLKTKLIKFSPYGDMPPRSNKTARKSTGPIGVPQHQLAPRHKGSSSGSNDPIGDLEAVAEPPKLFQLKCLSHASGAATHLNRNNPSVLQI
jgi:hypothetical protein